MYPSVVSVLGFHFNKNFPAKVVTEEEVNAQQFPSKTHLTVILALQRVMGNVLSSRFTRRLALSEGHVTSLMACLRESFLFARKVNDAFELRMHLQHAGWTYGKTEVGDIPSLLLQEVEGKEQYLSVLFHLIREQNACVDERKREDARRQMMQLVKQAMEEYLTWTVGAKDSSLHFNIKTPADARQRTVCYTSLLVGILTQLSELGGPEVCVVSDVTTVVL
jgi:hypothetical protein